MGSNYLNSQQLELLKNVQSEALHASAYISTVEGVIEDEVKKFPDSGPDSADSAPNFYTTINTDIELGYYFGTNINGNGNKEKLEQPMQRDPAKKPENESNASNTSPAYSDDNNYILDVTDSQLPAKKGVGIDRQAEHKLEGYVGDEALDDLARLVLGKPALDKEDLSPVTEEAHLELISAITQFDDIIDIDGKL
jgi:hypothetical protein